MGILFILIAGLGFSIVNALVKALPEVPVAQIVFLRSSISLIICIVQIKHKSINPWGNNKKDLILRGLTGSIALYSLFFVLTKIPFATAMTLHHTAPLFAIITSYFVLKETVNKIQLFSLGLAFIGIVSVYGFTGEVLYLYYLIAIFSAFMASLAYAYIRKLKDTDDPLIVVFYFPLISVFIFGLMSVFNWHELSLNDWGIALSIGVLTQIAQITMTKAYYLEKLPKIMIFNYLSVFWAAVIGFFVFKESIGPREITGICIVFIAIIISQLPKLIKGFAKRA